MKYLVAIPVPEPWRSRLMEVKSSLRPEGWRDTMDPHITLLAPGRPMLPPKAAQSAFRTAPIGWESFRVIAPELSRFSRRHRHTLVLRVESPSLPHLFSSFLEYSTWQDTISSRRHPYEPHITLANQVTDHQLYTVERLISNYKLEVEFDCQEIVLYAKQSHWPAWQVLTRRTASSLTPPT